jgi:hypothetical protein
MAGLHVPDKAERVASYQAKTVHVALEIVGALGHTRASSVSGKDVLRRLEPHGLRNYDEIYPWLKTPVGSLVRGDAPPAMQAIWDGRGSHDVRSPRTSLPLRAAPAIVTLTKTLPPNPNLTARALGARLRGAAPRVFSLLHMY